MEITVNGIVVGAKTAQKEGRWVFPKDDGYGSSAYNGVFVGLDEEVIFHYYFSPDCREVCYGYTILSNPLPSYIEVSEKVQEDIYLRPRKTLTDPEKCDNHEFVTMENFEINRLVGEGKPRVRLQECAICGLTRAEFENGFKSL